MLLAWVWGKNYSGVAYLSRWMRGKRPPCLEQSKIILRPAWLIPYQGPLKWPTHQRHPMLKLAKKWQMQTERERIWGRLKFILFILSASWGCGRIWPSILVIEDAQKTETMAKTGPNLNQPQRSGFVYVSADGRWWRSYVGSGVLYVKVRL